MTITAVVTIHLLPPTPRPPRTLALSTMADAVKKLVEEKMTLLRSKLDQIPVLQDVEVSKEFDGWLSLLSAAAAAAVRSLDK